MNLLTAERITKAFTDKVLLDEADFSIHEGDKIGIIGVNGTGKTTLLKIIAGLEMIDGGNIAKANNLTIHYLSQTPEFVQGDTVLEAVLRGNKRELNEWSVESEAKSILQTLQLEKFDEKVDILSGGQKKRVALANSILIQSDILILDEPTNHLDNEMSAWLEEYLVAFKGALIMVTHDRYFLDRVSNRIVEIERGKLYNYVGNYSEYVRLHELRHNMESATQRKRKSILKTELEWLARGARARSTKQKAHIQRIEDMKSIADIKAEETVQMSSVYSRLGKKIIHLESLSKGYDGRALFVDFSYTFLKGDRIGIIGKNGCGKSTLLKIITGKVLPDKGEIEIGQTVKIGYFSQENEELDYQMRVIDYIKEIGEYVKTADGSISASQMLEQFLFDGTLQWSKIEKLSGGERRRLYLLRILMSEPNILILDEPTNDLDIQTLTILEDYLDTFEGVVITVSHDRYFLDRVVRRIFVFEENSKIRQVEGNYSDYLYTKPDETITQTATKEKKGTSQKPREKKLKFTYQEEKEFAVIEEEVAALEEKLEEVERQTTKAAGDYEKVNVLWKEKEITEEELERKMERWMYLSDLYERIQEAQEK